MLVFCHGFYRSRGFAAHLVSPLTHSSNGGCGVGQASSMREKDPGCTTKTTIKLTSYTQRGVACRQRYVIINYNLCKKKLIPCFSLLEPAVSRVSGVSDVAGSDEGCLPTSVHTSVQKQLLFTVTSFTHNKYFTVVCSQRTLAV